MNEENKIENQLATLAIDNDQEIANFVDLIDSSLEPYRIQVSKLGLEAGRESQKAITKQKNKVAKFFKEKRDYFNSMSKKIIGVEKTINAPLLELEEDLKAQCEAEMLRQEKAYRVSMRPIRQASLEGLGLHIDEEALDSMTDTEFNEQVSAMLAQIAQAKKEEEEAKKRAEELEEAKAEAAEKAKKEAEEEAEKKLKALKIEKRQAQLPEGTYLLFSHPDEESQALKDLLELSDEDFEKEVIEMKKSIENIKAKKAQEKAAKDKEEAEAKAQADKEKILGESRYAIIEGLGLAGYCTASKQIVIEKAGVMDEETWDLSLASLKARKFEAEEKAKEEAEKARKEKAEKNRLEALGVADRGLTTEYTGEGEEECCIIKHNGIILEVVPVWCVDAEDACLYRAYSWVLPLLDKVYALGYKDGCQQFGGKE
jgi:hypothetical protein